MQRYVWSQNWKTFQMQRMKLPLPHVTEHARNAGNPSYVHVSVVEDSTESMKQGDDFLDI